MLPLSDTLVLDLTQVIAGPTAGQILGDMGADVIKVEPLHGEHFRPHFGGAWVPSMNRNKRGLALDLRTAGRPRRADAAGRGRPTSSWRPSRRA